MAVAFIGVSIKILSREDKLLLCAIHISLLNAEEAVESFSTGVGLPSLCRNCPAFPYTKAIDARVMLPSDETDRNGNECQRCTIYNINRVLLATIGRMID